MSRTDLDPTTLAASLRCMAGDGSMEWVCEPMQTRVLLDVADMLDENAKLRELARYALRCATGEVDCASCPYGEPTKWGAICKAETAARELGIEVDA